MTKLPASWQPVLAEELDKPYFSKLSQFLKEERQEYTVYPAEKDMFTALKLTPYADVKVLILGQDPYHNVGQAHGLAFSVPPGIQLPPSLLNIFKELRNDLGCRIPNNGCLIPWAEQGVLLLNAVLTVRAHQANSHQGKGWEKFTDAVIQKISDREGKVVFVFWGGNARKKVKLVDTDRHTIIQSAHPSPLSAHHGFFNSKPFSAINKVLQAAGESAIDWQIPDV
jgi:uracil-DNA glycosylase